MAPTKKPEAAAESPEARAARLRSILDPHLAHLLRDAPDFGSIRLEAFLREGEVGRVEIGASVSRVIPARKEGE